jgi:selenide,water dikinase
VLCGLPLMSDPNVIRGLERMDDAGVYKLRDDLAIIQTLDFFTPIVDDPYIFGQIAVANALSDVYAMGGRPLTAMNIVCFPVNTMDVAILRDILAGGLDKMREAGVVLVGGHSVEDPEPKYGLSVTGVIHPDKVLANTAAQVGDKLILTKPLGTGLVNTAVKGKMASEAMVAKSIKCMTALNKTGAELMNEVGVHACTDVTGFGFLGHACEMIEGTDTGMVINASSVPFFPEVQELVETGMVPAGLYRNRDFRMPMIEASPDIPYWLLDILFDPQTSGGLLIALAPEKAAALLQRLYDAGVDDAAIVGEITDHPAGKIVVR